VIDTSVVVVALGSRDAASNALLKRVGTMRFKLLATPALFREYREVLKRPEQQLANATL